MEINFKQISIPQKGALILVLGDDLKLSGFAAEINKKTGGLIAKATKSGQFTGKKGTIFSFIAPDSVPFSNIVFIGKGGAKDNLTEFDIEAAGGQLYSHLNSAKIKSAQMVIDNKIGKLSEERVAALVAYGFTLKSYNFDKYFTKKKADEKPTLKEFTVATDSYKQAKELFADMKAVSDGVFFTRDLVTEPPNVIYPASLAERCKELAKLGVKIEVLGEQQMKKLGMGSLLGVAQGSVNEPKLVIMQYNGGKKDAKPVAFVGKGVTFDTGGISLKPAGGMEDMKYDMAGAGAVIGTMKALALRGAKVNAVGLVGLVENMPSGNAQRPSDVVKSMSGQTIEVLNTDAEGRLVLADVLWYCQDRFKPKFMVNLATLTGAITVALGSQYAGIFSNNDELSEKLINSGGKVFERLWRFPLGEAYDRQINSNIADMQNIGNEKGAGSITAAQFLQRFVNNVPWAHLDIAGVAWTKKDLAIIPKGATGFGVRLLNKLVADYYEGK